MTCNQINELIAIYCKCNWYAVEKLGWYYRPNAQGYTNRINEAGKYLKEDAEREIVRGESMSIVKIPSPDYCHDLNAMHEAEKHLSYEEGIEYYHNLIRLGVPHPIAIHASARHRSIAFLKTINRLGITP